MLQPQRRMADRQLALHGLNSKSKQTVPSETRNLATSEIQTLRPPREHRQETTSTLRDSQEATDTAMSLCMHTKMHQNYGQALCAGTGEALRQVRNAQLSRLLINTDRSSVRLHLGLHAGTVRRWSEPACGITGYLNHMSQTTSLRRMQVAALGA